jgi:hypothetical protein
MKKEIWFIESGRKRKGEKARCLQCNKEFIRRVKAKRKKVYCSKSCAYEGRKKERVDLKCSNCKKKMSLPKSRLKTSKHGYYFCSSDCHNKAMRIDSGVDMVRPSHFGTGYTAYKRKCRDKFNDGCICGEKRKYLLTIHHKDGNKKNGKDENLEVVCGRCHAIRHLKKTENGWMFDTKSLTPRKVVEQMDEKI